MKLVSATFLAATLISAPALAQTGAAQTPPKPQTQTPPPATTQAPAKPPAAATAPPIVPLPEGAKVAIINPDYIAQESAAGKAIMAQLKTLSEKRNNELQNLQTQIQALQNKKTTQASVLTAQAVAQIDKDIERQNLDLQYKQQTAQKEFQDLQNELFDDLATKMSPVLEAYAKEKGLQVILDLRNVTWAAAGMDISADIVKRLDAIKK